MSELQRKLAQRRSINGESEDQSNPNFIFTKIVPLDATAGTSKKSPRGLDANQNSFNHPLPAEIKGDPNKISAEPEKIKPVRMTEELHVKLSRRLSLNGETEEVISPTKMLTVQDSFIKSHMHKNISVHDGSAVDAQLKPLLEANKLKVDVEEKPHDFEADLASLKKMLSTPMAAFSPSEPMVDSAVKSVSRTLVLDDDERSVAASEITQDTSFEDTLAAINNRFSNIGLSTNRQTSVHIGAAETNTTHVSHAADASFANLNLLSFRKMRSEARPNDSKEMHDFFSPLDAADDESVHSFRTANDTPQDSPSVQVHSVGLSERGTNLLGAMHQEHPAMHKEHGAMIDFDPDALSPKGQTTQLSGFAGPSTSQAVASSAAVKRPSLTTRKSISLTIESSSTPSAAAVAEAVGGAASCAIESSTGTVEEKPPAAAPLSLGDFVQPSTAPVVAPVVRVEPAAEFASAFVAMNASEDRTPVALMDIKVVKEQFLAAHHHSEGTNKATTQATTNAAAPEGKSNTSAEDTFDATNETIQQQKAKSLKHSIYFDQSFIDQGGVLVDPKSVSTGAQLLSATSDSVPDGNVVVEPPLTVTSESSSKFDYPVVSSADTSPLNHSSSDDRSPRGPTASSGPFRTLPRPDGDGSVNPRGSEYMIPLSYHDMSVSPKEESASSSSSSSVGGGGGGHPNHQAARRPSAGTAAPLTPPRHTGMLPSTSTACTVAAVEATTEARDSPVVPPPTHLESPSTSKLVKSVSVNQKKLKQLLELGTNIKNGSPSRTRTASSDSVDAGVTESLSTQTTVNDFPRDTACAKGPVFTASFTEDLEVEGGVGSTGLSRNNSALPPLHNNNRGVVSAAGGAAGGVSGQNSGVVSSVGDRGSPEAGNIIAYHTTTTTKTVVTTRSTSFVKTNSAVSSTEELVVEINNSSSSTYEGSTSSNNSSSSSSSNNATQRNLAEIEQHSSTNSMTSLESPPTPIDTGSKDISCLIFGFDVLKLFDVKCT